MAMYFIKTKWSSPNATLNIAIVSYYLRTLILRVKLSDCFEVELVLPGYEMILNAAHTFNMLDACGAISVTERADLHWQNSYL